MALRAERRVRSGRAPAGATFVDEEGADATGLLVFSFLTELCVQLSLKRPRRHGKAGVMVETLAGSGGGRA
jgi:hypothetical protein